MNSQDLTTVADVARARNNQVILLQRHPQYHLTIGGEWGETKDKAIIRRLSNTIPDSFFPLTQEAIERCTAQGAWLAANCLPKLILFGRFVAQQGALHIARGMCPFVSAPPLPVHDPNADYPFYRTATLGPLMGNLDQAVIDWMNGKHPLLTRVPFPEFHHQVTELTEFRLYRLEQVVPDGPVLIVSHFEIVTLAHRLWVLREEPGSFSGSWFPKYSEGIVLFRNEHDALEGIPYDAFYKLVR